jgi:O-antigen/teichoic acid export membrane protein
MSEQLPPERRPAARVPPAQSGTAIRGGAARALGYAAGVLVSLATAAIIVRRLGIATFGRYVTVTSLVALVGGVTEAGIVVYGMREFLAREGDARRRLMANLLALRLALAAVGVAVAIAFAAVAGYGGTLVLATLVAGAGLLAQVIADVLSISLQAQLLLGRMTFVELVRRLLGLAIAGALALAGAGVVSFVAAGSVSAGAAAALMAFTTRRFVSARLEFDVAYWRALFADTLPYAVALSIAAVYLYVTVIVMSIASSALQTGLFATSFRVVQAALAVPALLLTAVFPLLARSGPGQRDAVRDAVGKVFTVAVLGGAWMSLATALGARFVIDVIAGAHGHAAAPVLRIQGLIFLVSFVSTSSALGLVSLKRYRPLIVASAGALVLDVGLALALIPALGARGGAIADVVTETVAAVWLTANLARAVPGHRISAAFIPALALALGASSLVLLLPLGSLARTALASVIYFGVLLLTRALPAELTHAARRLPLLR